MSKLLYKLRQPPVNNRLWLSCSHCPKALLPVERAYHAARWLFILARVLQAASPPRRRIGAKNVLTASLQHAAYTFRFRIHRCVLAASLIGNTLTERATAAAPPTRKQNCMPAETRPPRSVPSPPPKRRRDMPRADRGRQQLLDDLGYVQPIFRAGNSGDCTIIKSVALLLVVIGLVVFVGRFAE